LLAQDWYARAGERTTEDGNDAAFFDAGEEGRNIISAGRRGGHTTPIGLTARWRAAIRDHVLT
jgi:hypothetical protein